MLLEQEIRLDFDDVLIRPKRSTLTSRSEVDIERDIRFRNGGWFKGVPILAANMDTIGTFEMNKALALHNNEIDLFTAWEPIVASSMKQHRGFHITFQRITTGYLYFSEAFVYDNPKLTNHILAAVIRSISWMKSDRKNLLTACDWNIMAIEKLIGEKSILNASEIAELALQDILVYRSKYSIVPKAEDIRTNSSLHKEYEFLAALNKEKKNNNWEKMAKSFDNNLINGILEHPEEFRLNDYDMDGKVVE